MAAAKARAAALPVTAYGKTGTSQDGRDAWFIGFTEQYVTGVWMGYDDNTPLKDVTGGGLPAEIWQAVMTEIHQGLPALPLGVIAPNAAGSVISASDIVSADSDDPLAAALAEAISAAQPVVEGQASSVEIGAERPVVTTGADGQPDALGAALAEAMGQPAPAAAAPAGEPAPAPAEPPRGPPAATAVPGRRPMAAAASGDRPRPKAVPGSTTRAPIRAKPSSARSPSPIWRK